MINQEEVILQTQAWIQKVIIACNFCPFASKVVREQKVFYKVEESTQDAACLQTFKTELKRLDDDENIETSFIIFPNAFTSFEHYLDFVDLTEKTLRKLKYEGVYQVASFHPEYCFSNEDEHDAANFTNRSIYPMVHLLREHSIDEALEHYHNPEEIPERNINFAREKGIDYMRLLRNSCI